MSARGWSLKAGPAALIAALGLEVARKKALWAAALDLQATWQDVLNRPGSGEARRQGGAASAPGEPPAPDTGALRGSIAVAWQDDGTVRVGSGLEYAPMLEYGTATIEPRPHARPAKDLAWDLMNGTMTATLKRG